MGNIDKLAAIAPGIWKTLAEIEDIGGIPISDVEYQWRYTRRGDLEVKATLDIYDFAVATAVDAVRKINDFLGGVTTTSGVYDCSVQPSGRQQGVRVNARVDGTPLIVHALFDAEQYAAAIAQESALPAVTA